MTARYFVAADGTYIGAFVDVPDAALPPGAIAVAAPPPIDGTQKWSGAAWSAPVPVVVEKGAAEKLADVLVAKGVLAAGDVATVKGAK